MTTHDPLTLIPDQPALLNPEDDRLEIEAIALHLAAANRRRASADNTCRRLRSQLLPILEEHGSFATSWVRVDISYQPRKECLDETALARDYPDIELARYKRQQKSIMYLKARDLRPDTRIDAAALNEELVERAGDPPVDPPVEGSRRKRCRASRKRRDSKASAAA